MSFGLDFLHKRQFLIGANFLTEQTKTCEHIWRLSFVSFSSFARALLDTCVSWTMEAAFKKLGAQVLENGAKLELNM